MKAIYLFLAIFLFSSSLAFAETKNIKHRPDWTPPKTTKEKFKDYAEARGLPIPADQDPEELIDTGEPIFKPENLDRDIPSHIKEVSQDQAEVVDYVFIDSQTVIFYQRFKNPGDNMPQFNAFRGVCSFTPKIRCTIMLGDKDNKIYDSFLDMIDNRTRVLTTLGRAILPQENRGFAGEPVKTVFVFFDPQNQDGRAFLEGPTPGALFDKGIRTIAIPVSLLPGSDSLALDFLKNGNENVCCGETPDTKCSEAITFNTSRLRKIYTKQKIVFPFIVYPTSLQVSKYRYKTISDTPTPKQILNLIQEVEPVSYWPFDGYYTLTSGEPVQACLDRLTK